MFYRLTNSGNNLFDELARVGSEMDELFDRTAWAAGIRSVVRETYPPINVTECAYGHVERSIPLPEGVESADARATYRNGVLRVELPKSTPRRRRTIKVDVT